MDVDSKEEKHLMYRVNCFSDCSTVFSFSSKGNLYRFFLLCYCDKATHRAAINLTCSPKLCMVYNHVILTADLRAPVN